MTKKDLENIICKYNSAESEVVELDARFGICLYNSSNENFYNKYKRLKEENIHICLDTAGYSKEDYSEILKLTDLVLLDIKHTNEKGFKELTNGNIKISEKFIDELNKYNKPVWIRQVIVPGITDTKEYLSSLKEYLKKIKNIQKIDFLPFHQMANDKYQKLGIKNQLENNRR